MRKFPFYKQHDTMDCGPACLRMVTKYYGKTLGLQALKELQHVNREGVSLLSLTEAAAKIGIKSYGVLVDLQYLVKQIPLPCILHWNQKHFVVLYKIKNNKFYISDPAVGKQTYNETEFISKWGTRDEGSTKKGIALLLEPTDDFFNLKEEKNVRTDLRYLLSHILRYKKHFIQLIIGVLIGSLIQLIFPFLTQAIVDVGIKFSEINFIYIILLAQLVLFASRMSVDFFRSWILLHIGTRINVSIISEFLIKLMNLPIRFFDTKMIGDITQRIQDHDRIENFLTTQTINTLFSIISFIVFSIVLATFNYTILLLFVTGSLLYIGWIYIFLNQRRSLDYKYFEEQAANHNNIYQLISGMPDIKLNQCEDQKRYDWEKIQVRKFKINMKRLSLSHYQITGSVVINETKNILLTFFAARAVVEGTMTLGEMLAVQYIIGQLNGPLSQMINFMFVAQDAKISLERLGDIHNLKDEVAPDEKKLKSLETNRNIAIAKVYFQYEGPRSPFVLKDIDIEIPDRKVTAIVGASGSGKTTLIKLLLGFYQPTKGNIYVGKNVLQNYDVRWWRSRCGAVLQDGYLFSESIAKNIGLSEKDINYQKLLQALEVANLTEFVESLPLKFNTIIGQNGIGISQGQKQRILIARAVYKDPDFLFFDEATNSLDANNEKVIIHNLDKFFEGRTVVVVAHRLSTVKNADQIIVLNKGEIIETGSHAELTFKKQAYYNLVKNQLELGN